jgi:hypothetical protein
LSEKKVLFFSANYIGPEGVIRHIADQKNSKSHHNLCSISACFQLRIFFVPSEIEGKLST